LHRDGRLAAEVRRAGDEVEATLRRTERDARAERRGVEGAAEREVAGTEWRRGFELAAIVALRRERARRVAALAAGRIRDSVAADRTELGGARGGAAVAAGDVAIVALLGAADDAVAAPGFDAAA